MNSGTIARSGGVTLLRAKTAELFTPQIDIVSYPAPARDPTSISGGPVSLPGQPISLSGRLGFFSYALGSGLYEDAAALLFADGLFAPSDTLQYLRGLVAYDVHDFERARQAFDSVPESSTYYSQARSFVDIYTSTPELPDYRDKSPLLAGAMSAVIPGSGKIYAGDLRSGISTLLIVGALGGIAAESWVKLGPKDWRTITLSSVFGLFYIGNIYGSALSVSVIKNSYQNAQKATLLFDLRIPLHQF